jgi:hypothetical protein
MVGGKVAADVPELLQVVGLAPLCGLDPERGVAALPAAAGLVVGALDRVRQGEEGLRVRQRLASNASSRPWSATTANPKRSKEAPRSRAKPSKSAS